MKTGGTKGQDEATNLPRPGETIIRKTRAEQIEQALSDLTTIVEGHTTGVRNAKPVEVLGALQQAKRALALSREDPPRFMVPADALSEEDLAKLKDQGSAGPITIAHDTSGLRLDGEELDARELAAILAGLRIIQAQGVPDEIDDVATDGGAFDVLDDDDIDDLCERINR